MNGSLGTFLSAGRTGLILLLLISGTYGLSWGDDMRGPWPISDGEPTGPRAESGSKNLGEVLVRLFETYISPIDGSHCPMYPSCSEYGLQCFNKHGFLAGWTMVWDRLYRCGRDELRLSPTIVVNGEAKCYDPVVENDFWWNGE